MGEALLLFRRYPKQIESGLETEYPGRDIGQWHRGEMSSRKLMVLIEGLSAESWLKQSVNSDIAREKADAERAALLAAHADVHGRLMGEIRSPYDMSMSVVEKHSLTD